jgi:hypothetical protein
MTMSERSAKPNSAIYGKSALERAQAGALELQGAQLEFFGRKFIALDGRLGAMNPVGGEVRGQVTIIAANRPSVLSGSVRLRVQGLEFELSMICVRDGMEGEMVVKFLGRLLSSHVRPILHS